MTDPAAQPVPVRPPGSPSTTTATGGVSRTPLPRWTVPVVAVVVLAATIVVLVVLWRWIDGLALTDLEKKATAQLDAVKVAASIAVGGGGLFALYLAARRQRTQELELEARHAELRHREVELAQRDRVQAHAEQVAETNRVHAERIAGDAHADAEARRITELYTKAAEQLGSDKAPVRLAGLYALERLAQDNPTQRQTIVSVLCAYLRMPYTLPGNQPADDADAALVATHRERVQEREVRLTAQAVLVTHLRPGPDKNNPNDTFWPDTDVNLTGATLIDLNLTNCQLRVARFDEASFSGNATFNAASFAGVASFNRANFAGNATFNAASFTSVAAFFEASFTRHASFIGVRFPWHASFDLASFAGDASFNKTNFTGAASFNKATFTGNTKLNEATFAGNASFNRANFTKAATFNRATFAGNATFNEATFTKTASFNRATFTKTATFTEAMFMSAVIMSGAAALANDAIRPLDVWPPGWTTDHEKSMVDERDRAWHQMVQVPVVPSDPPPSA